MYVYYSSWENYLNQVTCSRTSGELLLVLEISHLYRTRVSYKRILFVSFNMWFIGYCIVEVGSDRAGRSHTARRLRPGIFAERRDSRRSRCAPPGERRRRRRPPLNGDTTILCPTVHVSNAARRRHKIAHCIP